MPAIAAAMDPPRARDASWAGTGAALGLVLAASGAWIIASHPPGPRPDAWPSTGRLLALGGLAAASLAGCLAVVAAWLVRRVPARVLFGLAFASALLPAALLRGLEGVGPALLVIGAILAAAMPLGAGAWGLLFAGPSGRRMALALLVPGALATTLGVLWMRHDGGRDGPTRGAASAAAAPREMMDDPARPGPFPVEGLTYGSGADRHRPEFGARAGLITPTVDGSRLVSGWEWPRTRHWGFDARALPLNARVWLPRGDGPSPLVVIAHGNHVMEDPSDAGYAYLGELLASRGFVVASVDETFLNASAVSIVAEELGLGVATPAADADARAWLILEHLKLWRSWAGMPGHRLARAADLGRVALIGHSRGGEAVALAAAFNRLSLDPDDATLPWDYGFGIRGVVAIAPVDGSSRPGGRRARLRGVDYLVLHGSHDDDVRSFVGLSQYARTAVDGGPYRFKAALYIEGANHNQFNEAWGREDLPSPAAGLRARDRIMTPGAQRRVAAIMVVSFLEATLRDRPEYLGVLRDPSPAGAGLPATTYLGQFLDSTFVPVATFDEDVDPTTTTAPGGSLRGEHLAVWREGASRGRSGHDRPDRHGVHLGWSPARPGAARYRIRLPGGLAPPARRPALSFTLAHAGDAPGTAIDLTLELVDRSGRSARLPLGHVGLLPPPIEARLARSRALAVLPTHEPIPRTYSFPLADFARGSADPGFDPAAPAAIHLRFDRTPEGLVILDDLGFVELDRP